VPQGSAQSGRHRARHRQDADRPSLGAALPGAAAAALTLTATGAVIIPGLGGSAAAQDAEPLTDSLAIGTVSTGRVATDALASGAVAGDAMARDAGASDGAGGQQATAGSVAGDLVSNRRLAAEGRARVQQASLARQIRHQREVAQQRASRARERAALDVKRRRLLASTHRWVLPVQDYRFTSGFGARWGKLHAGDDFAAPIGTPIGALSSGTVIFAGMQSGFGNKVEIRHWDGTVSWYGHMSTIAVNVGQGVKPGEKIGEVGNTGHSTGPHLHLEIHPDGGGPVDPTPWLRAHGLSI
jgi:murein DD-endopeptidase MepM/ murein hydrolase activator NlpD